MRVSVHPRILEETGQVIKLRATEETARLREELTGVQSRVKNFKSQVTRLREPDADRHRELSDQIAAGQKRTIALKRDLMVRERD